MRLTASDIYNLYRPSPCELRAYLIGSGVESAPAGAFQELLRKLGERHERAHLATFDEVLDLSVGEFDERERRTHEAVRSGYSVIFQPVLKTATQLGGIAVEIVGEPDFLIRGERGYAIRDCKISRRITEQDHPEILRQLTLYGWLYARSSGEAPGPLEVFDGSGAIAAVEYDGGKSALADLERIIGVVRRDSPPISPVGWSKCGDCGYNALCWTKAVNGHDVALVCGVDQGLARVLQGEQVSTYELLAGYDEARLADVRRPWGQSLRRVGKSAASILRNATALATGRDELLSAPDIPDVPNFVMFDLEGLPPQLDEMDKVYLWGTQVFGERPSLYRPALAGFGEDGDREGWDTFLDIARRIFDEYGDIPFVHWATYEKTKLSMYVERFGDADGVAQRVRGNLLDLLAVTQRSIALPLPSYSLKVVEKRIGFKRTQAEYGGEWSMARYIEATESQDAALRNQVMDEICTYNREDLEATWAVMQWLRSRFGLGKADPERC